MDQLLTLLISCRARHPGPFTRISTPMSAIGLFEFSTMTTMRKVDSLSGPVLVTPALGYALSPSYPRQSKLQQRK